VDMIHLGCVFRHDLRDALKICEMCSRLDTFTRGARPTRAPCARSTKIDDAPRNIRRGVLHAAVSCDVSDTYIAKRGTVATLFNVLAVEIRTSARRLRSEPPDVSLGLAFYPCHGEATWLRRVLNPDPLLSLGARGVCEISTCPPSKFGLWRGDALHGTFASILSEDSS